MEKDTVKSTNNPEDKIAYRVLTEPWITEDSSRMMELNKYVFKVSGRSNKKEIVKAVEETYQVKVLKVNVINMPRKSRVQGRTKGWKSGFKKAIVTVKEGEKIDFYN